MEKIKTICGICPGQCHVECDMDTRRIKSIKKSDEKPSALCLRGLYSDQDGRKRNTRIQKSFMGWSDGTY